MLYLWGCNRYLLNYFFSHLGAVKQAVNTDILLFWHKVETVVYLHIQQEHSHSCIQLIKSNIHSPFSCVVMVCSPPNPVSSVAFYSVHLLVANFVFVVFSCQMFFELIFFAENSCLLRLQTMLVRVNQTVVGCKATQWVRKMLKCFVLLKGNHRVCVLIAMCDTFHRTHPLWLFVNIKTWQQLYIIFQSCSNFK